MSPTKARAVRLARVLQIPPETRRPAETDQQHAGGVGIERAGMTDTTLPVQLAHPRDDIMRRPRGRFIYDNKAVMHFYGRARCGRVAAPASSLADARRSGEFALHSLRSPRAASSRGC